MSAPVIACVVEMGIPHCVTIMMVEAAAASAQKPPTGVRRVIPEPIVLTMRPAAGHRPCRHRDLARDHHPERHVEILAESALRVQEHRDDARRQDDQLE